MAVSEERRERSGIWALDNWFFGYGSPLAIGIFRAVMGGLIFLNFTMMLVSYHDWFSNHGYVPASIGERYFPPFVDLYGLAIPRLNLFGIDPGPVGTACIYGATLVSALLATIGLWTRAATIVLAVCIVSIHHRNGLILHGGDTLIRQCAIYLALAPSGAAFSIDRLLRVRAGKAAAIPLLVSLWPQRLIQCQVAIIYFTSTWHKYTGHHWRDGTAVWYPLHLNEFDRLPVPGVAYHPVMIGLATYGTLIVQLAMATLVFYKPLRIPVLVAAAGLHLFIDYSMNIPLFSFLMIATYVVFFDGEEWAAFFDRVRQWWRGRRRLPVEESP